MSRQHHYTTDLRWTGNTGEGTRHYRAYERNYTVQVNGKPELAGSSDPAFRGDADRYNPEELLLASLSACHMLWYLHLCADAGVVVTDYRDRASATLLEEADGSGRITRVVLQPRVTVARADMRERAEQLHEAAHRHCFIARSVNFPVAQEPQLRVADFRAPTLPPLPAAAPVSLEGLRVLVLDNYDSFTYNLVQYIEEILGRPVDVFRNDAIELEEVAAYDLIVLSPGPGIPAEAGIMPELIERYAPEKVILGVCLGHQAIGEAFGGRLHNLAQVFHGLETPVTVTDPDDPLFQGLPPTFRVGRYHSWVVMPEHLPAALQVTALDEQGAIMALRHREYEVFGVQFHPESVMTEHGHRMIENFLTHAATCVVAPQTSRK